MKNIITVENLTKSFQLHQKEEGLKGSIKGLFNRKYTTKTAVDNISFQIKEGEFIGFIGKNGAGKTTTLKLLTGLLFPTTGTINVLGFNPAKRENQFKKQFAIVLGQKSQLIDVLPPIETFKLNAAIYEVDQQVMREKVDKLAEMLSVKDILNVPTRKLSLGQRMKCELIAALIHNPKILFLDEPSIGLDIISQQAIRKFLAEYNKVEKTTILLTSHYMDDVEELCQRLIIIDNGKIGYDGKLSTLMNKYNKSKSIQIECFEPILALPKHPGIINSDKKNDLTLDLEVKSQEITQIIEYLFKTYQIRDIKIENVSLEEVIADIFRSK